MRNVSHKAHSIECEAIKQTFQRQRNARNPLLFNYRLSMPVENVASVRDILAVHNESKRYMGKETTSPISGAVHDDAIILFKSVNLEL